MKVRSLVASIFAATVIAVSAANVHASEPTALSVAEWNFSNSKLVIDIIDDHRISFSAEEADVAEKRMRKHLAELTDAVSDVYGYRVLILFNNDPQQAQPYNIVINDVVVNQERITHSGRK